MRGVIAAEMPANWSAEALKAQAVAARTYAITSDAGGSDFDLYADTRSQMYGGVAAETPTSDAAVAATRGQIVTYHGAPVVTYFFSSSGGQTENVQNVWPGSTPEPWLRGVVDRYDGAGGDPYHRWSYQLSMGAAAAKLGSWVKGKLVGIKVTQHGVSPRIITAEVVGTKGTTTVTGGAARAGVRAALDVGLVHDDLDRAGAGCRGRGGGSAEPPSARERPGARRDGARTARRRACRRGRGTAREGVPGAGAGAQQDRGPAQDPSRLAHGHPCPRSAPVAPTTRRCRAPAPTGSCTAGSRAPRSRSCKAVEMPAPADRDRRTVSALPVVLRAPRLDQGRRRASRQRAARRRQPDAADRGRQGSAGDRGVLRGGGRGLSRAAVPGLPRRAAAGTRRAGMAVRPGARVLRRVRMGLADERGARGRRPARVAGGGRGRRRREGAADDRRPRHVPVRRRAGQRAVI